MSASVLCATISNIWWINTVGAEMNEHTRDLLQAQGDEIAALDEDIEALSQKRQKLFDKRARLLAEHGTSAKRATNP